MATTSDDDTDEPFVRRFVDFLLEQSKGTTHDELSASLNKLVSRVRDTGKKGSLTLVISVAPLKRNTDILEVSDLVRLKLPESERRPSIFYPTDEGNLSRSDPNQPVLSGLKGLDGGKGGASTTTSTEAQA